MFDSDDLQLEWEIMSKVVLELPDGSARHIARLISELLYRLQQLADEDREKFDRDVVTIEEAMDRHDPRKTQPLSEVTV